MNTKVSELTVEELRELILNTVRESLEDHFEDAQGSSSKNFLQSIQEARADYEAGRSMTLEQALDL